MILLVVVVVVYQLNVVVIFSRVVKSFFCVARFCVL